MWGDIFFKILGLIFLVCAVIYAQKKEPVPILVYTFSILTLVCFVITLITCGSASAQVTSRVNTV